MGKRRLTVVADRGYFSGRDQGLHQAGITPLVPKPMTSNAKAEGRFSKADFIYIAKDDQYRCPAGERAIKRFTTVEHGMTLHKYWTSACPRARSRGNARPATIGASPAGSTRPCWRRCSGDSIANPG